MCADTGTGDRMVVTGGQYWSVPCELFAASTSDGMSALEISAIDWIPAPSENENEMGHGPWTMHESHVRQSSSRRRRRPFQYAPVDRPITYPFCFSTAYNLDIIPATTSRENSFCECTVDIAAVILDIPHVGSTKARR